MNIRPQATLGAQALLALAASGGPALAQQDPTVVRVEGLAEVQASLRRVEAKLDLLISAPWEYRFVQRNRLVDVDATVAELGRAGWELIAVTQEEGFVFKRRVGR